MKKRSFIALLYFVKNFSAVFFEFLGFLYLYLKTKIIVSGIFFEKHKNILVKVFMIKRGRYSRPFLHLSTMFVLGIGIISAPFLAQTYPVLVLSANNSLDKTTQQQSINLEDDVFNTDVSQKPRDKIISYIVQKGDTVSTISEKFGISTNTIRWENNLSDDALNVGDTLKILPVTGISYKVQSADTIYTIAKKFDTQAQKIVDFPFNDFANPETFSLVAGQMLIIPDGIKPSQQPYIKQEVYFAQGPTSMSSAGFSWPVRGILSQSFSWYHQAIDIAASLNSPIYAATGGKVIEALAGGWNTGYGNTIVVDSGNGYITRYSHLSAVNVSVGDNVIGGQTVIGAVGVTGKTTGPHIDFRVSKNGVYINPFFLLNN